MLIFAVITNGFAGVWGGTYMLMNSEGLLCIFPLLNISSSYLLFAMLKGGTIDEDCISDENVNLLELSIGASIAALAFIICKYALGFHWAGTLSICIFYATNFSVPVIKLIFRSKARA